ncbi:DUF5958 family protein [Streptomyces albogriseolus]|uniref:Uncharacterized protein n=1 Tax=Streptomyces albogriseolus TaxID=1887 RepID=A0ACC6UHX6_STRAO
MTERDVILNELAQGLRPTSPGITWFDALAPEEQSEAPLHLRHHCVQARAVAEEGPEGIRRAGLRPTHTPAVLITHGRVDDQLGKIAPLTPRDERRKAFRLLVAVLAIADGRRRERTPGWARIRRVRSPTDRQQRWSHYRGSSAGSREGHVHPALGQNVDHQGD